MRFLIIFIFFIYNALANAETNIKNLVINKELKKINSLTFFDVHNNKINLDDYQGKLVLINFWATWCAPCKKEMPSLDQLQINNKLFNLKIFPINIGQEKTDKAQNFFKDLEIKNLEVYFDSSINLAKKFSLRGIPTSILINKNGQEFARIIGSINFNDDKFVDWLSSYN